MRRSSDDENPFDDIFSGMEEMMNKLTGDDPAPVEIHEHDDRITVVADIRGVEKADIDLQCDGRALAIHASTETGPYLKRIDLPSYVDDQSTSASYNNGVLEVTLDRANDPANIGYY